MIIVHGATGAQGSPVLTALRTAGLDAAGAGRDPSAVDGAAVLADYDDPDGLRAAYRDASAVFVHLPVGPPDHQVRIAQAVTAALADSPVERVVASTSGYPLVPGSGPTLLAEALASSGRSTALVVPRLFLENLLLPTVVGPVHEEGVLRYPIRADIPLSWSSHLDVADVAVALLRDPDVEGRVEVGALPPLTGPDLAAGFAHHLGRSVVFEEQDPEDFGRSLVPLFGEAGTRPVVESYRRLWEQDGDVVDGEASAQQRLGLTPRNVSRWLADVGA